MIWRLVRHGRILFAGNRATVLGAAEERGWIVVETLGRDTADPVRMPRVAIAGVQILPVPSGDILRRAA